MSGRRRHALLVGYGGGHIAMLVPVAKALETRGWRASMMALTTVSKVARDAGFEPLGFADFLALAAPGAGAYGENLCPDTPKHGLVSRRETIAYHGANFAGRVARHGLEDAHRRYALEGRQAFLPIDFMAAVIRHLAPDVVVTTNSPRAEQAAASRQGVWGSPQSALSTSSRCMKSNGWARTDLRTASASQRQRQGHGRGAWRNGDDIVVSGNPAFDAINDAGTVAAGARLREQRGWNDGRCTILWASNKEPARHPFTREPGDPEMPRQVEACLQALVSADDRLRLVVRRHPNETIPVVLRNGLNKPQHGSTALAAPRRRPRLRAIDHGFARSLARAQARHHNRLLDFTGDAPFSRMSISYGVAGVRELALDLAGMGGNKPAFPLPGQIQPPRPIGLRLRPS